MIDDESEGPSIDSFLRDAAHVDRIEVEPDRIGRQLARFRIDREIGRGGMGIVYAAADVELGRQVALKVLPRAAVADGDRRRRFLREARTAASLAHPNIAAVFDVGEADGTVFLAMELVPGKTLRAAIAAHPAGMPVVDVLRIARAIAAGLGKAHSRRIVHRDLKPENVMMDSDGSPKLVDFGLAKLHSREGEEADAGAGADLSTQDGKILGTPSYMAPEQAKGSFVTPAADVFSLGVVLYEMLTGRRPFGGATLVDVLVSTARDEPEPPSKIAPRVPRYLDRLVLRCLAKSPEGRPTDGDAVVAALDAGAGADAGAKESRASRMGWSLLGLAVASGLAVAIVRMRADPGRARGAADNAASATPSAATSTAPIAVTTEVSRPTPPFSSTASDTPASALPSASARARPTATGAATNPSSAPRGTTSPPPSAPSSSAINPLARQK